MELKKRATIASVWVMTGYGFAQILRLATNLIMTRLLVPEAFGLMVVVTAILVGLDMMSDMGIRTSVIYHKRGEERAFRETAWTLQIIRGALIWCLSLVVAGLLFLLSSWKLLPADTIYADPLLPQVIIVTTFSSVLKGFQSINLHLASRNLILGRVSVLGIAGQAMAIPIMVIWASHDASIWALVFGGLTAVLVRTIGSHIFIPGPRGRLGWDSASFWEMLNFGKWILVSSWMGFLVHHGDRFLIAGFLASREMGYYAIAILFAESARNLFSRIIGGVVFPAVSEAARDSKTRVSTIYYKFRSRADPILFFIAGMTAVLGDDLIRILYDDRYVEAGWMLQILSASIFFGPFQAQGKILLALGMSRMHAIATAIGGALLLISIPILFHYFGTVGAVVAAAIRLFWGIPVGIWAISKLEILRPRRELLFLPMFFVGAAVGWTLNSM